MKQICFLVIISFWCTMATFSNATTLLFPGGTNTITLDNKTYNIVDRKNSSDVWNGASEIGGYTSSDYTGLYIGTITKDNDDREDLLKIIRYFLDDPKYWITTVKVDRDDEEPNDVFTVTYNNGNKSGEWNIIPSSNFFVDFYSIKGANEFALYYVNPALQDGLWTTRHLLNNGGNIPDISHITVVKDPPLPTPEPATLLLFSTGVAGLAGLARRKKTA